MIIGLGSDITDTNPTFTVTVENSGEAPETNVKVDVTVSAGGKQYKASHVINQTQPGNKVNVEIPVSGIPLGVAAKVQVNIEGVPGETLHPGPDLDRTIDGVAIGAMAIVAASSAVLGCNGLLGIGVASVEAEDAGAGGDAGAEPVNERETPDG